MLKVKKPDVSKGDSGIEFPDYKDSKIPALNLNGIAEKLQASKEAGGVGMKRSHIAMVIKRYRQFLWLRGKYPMYKLHPPIDIDRVWHIHIWLSTSKYASDCNLIFGYFLHHEPCKSCQNKLDRTPEQCRGITETMLKKYFPIMDLEEIQKSLKILTDPNYHGCLSGTVVTYT